MQPYAMIFYMMMLVRRVESPVALAIVLLLCAFFGMLIGSAGALMVVALVGQWGGKQLSTRKAMIVGGVLGAVLVAYAASFFI